MGDEIPAELDEALQAPEGGKIAIVLGAGCSHEPPTDLPLSPECARRAHEQLVEDGILLEGDCSRPEDLSAVSDAVYSRTGSQHAVVDRLPMARFDEAEPNEGYLIAIALLLEQVAVALVTLNIDLAVDHAVSSMDAVAKIPILTEASHFQEMGVFNVAHLHGSTKSDPEHIILRTEQLELAWDGEWRQLLATRFLATPVVIFAGLGTPAAVVVETTRRMREAFTGHRVLQVDPAAYGDSKVTEAVQPDVYIQLGWCDFMRRLGTRLATRQAQDIAQAVEESIQEGLFPNQDSSKALSELSRLGLLELGRLRASWQLSSDSYEPARGTDPRLLSDLLYGVARVQSLAGGDLRILPDGNGELTREGEVLAVLVPASGRGVVRWNAVEARLRTSNRLSVLGATPLLVVMSGIPDARPEPAPPEDLVAGPDDSIVTPGRTLIMVTVDELVASPELATGAWQ